MGLDKQTKRVLNKYMKISRLLSQLGLGDRFGQKPKLRQSPMARERQRYETDMRQQLIELKKKGLSIPVFTL